MPSLHYWTIFLRIVYFITLWEEPGSGLLIDAVNQGLNHLIVAHNLHHVVSKATSEWEQKMEDGAYKRLLCTRTRNGIDHFCPHDINPTVRDLKNAFKFVAQEEQKEKKKNFYDHFTLTSTWRIYLSPPQRRQQKVSSTQFIQLTVHDIQGMCSLLQYMNIWLLLKWNPMNWRQLIFTTTPKNTHTHI